MENKTSKIIIDFFFFVAVLVPSLVLLILESPDLPFQRGFYCDDETLRYPYRPDTISVGVLMSVGLLVPIITMFICEWMLYRHWAEQGSSWQPYSRQKVCCYKTHPWATALYSTIGPFLLGGGITLLLTDAGKHVIGRLRPHFIAVCEPDWSVINCTNEGDFSIYVQDIPCLGTDESKLANARLSFPSGHSSSAFYVFSYWMIYMQARMIPEVFGDTLLRPFLQMVGFLMAMLVSLSRISDYKHHWSDVLAGSVLGLAVAWLVAVFVSDLFRNPVSSQGRLERGETLALYGSGSAMSFQSSSDGKDQSSKSGSHAQVTKAKEQPDMIITSPALA
ncbi:phospholipid phosphatase 1-like [Diadema setosum]|uniref:phospholipid phosphatase 1-like n=1 Tax=Diadema setosum TaxID=31175 RepID=UPI003B3B2908